MSNDDSRVEFEIDVTQSPTARARIEGLTKLVMDSQAKMTMGVERMGVAAQSVAAGMSPLVAKMEAFKKSSIAGVDGLRSEFNKLDSAAGKRIDRTIKISVVGLDRVKELEASIDRMAAAAGRGPTVPSPIPGMPGPSVGGRGRSGGTSGMDVPDNLRGMFKKLEAEAGSSADAIGKAMDDKIGKLPKLQEGTESLKKAFKERSDAAKKLRDDYEKAVDNMGEASERMNSSLVKGGRSLIGMTKGFAELGLMSTETTEQLARGMVAVQGAFDIFDGAADMLESVAGARKAKRMAKRAASEVAEAGAALAGNAVVNAGGKMASGIGGRVLGAGAVTAVASAGASAAGVGATGAAVGAGGAGVAGVGAAGAGLTGLLAPAAAAAAALASVGLVAVQLKETFQGTATKAGSVTDTIATWEVQLGASLVRMGRTDKSILEDKPDNSLQGQAVEIGANAIAGPVIGGLAPMINSFFTSSAKSQIQTKRMERSTKVNDIKQTQKDASGNLELDLRYKTEMQGFQNRTRVVRGRSENTFGTDAAVTKESQFREMSMRRLAESQSVVDRGGDASQADSDKAKADVKMQQDALMKSQLRQNSAQMGQSTSNLKDEQGIGNAAALELLKVRRELATIDAEGGASAEKVEKLRKHEAEWSAMAVGSLDRQKALTKERLSIALSGESQVRDLLKSQLDVTSARLDKNKSDRKSAAINFAQMGEIEKQQAIRAFEEAKKKDPKDLSDETKNSLRSTGIASAIRMADKGDEAEAEKYGFTKNFGAEFDQENAGLLKAKQQIEAKLSTSYDVSVKLNNDTSAIVSSVTSTVEGLLKQGHEQITKAIYEQLQSSLTEINNRAADQMRNLGKQRI